MATDFTLIGDLDLKTPDIVQSPNIPKALTNLEFSSKGISLRSRKGIYPNGQVGDFIGLHTYSYTDATTGANIEIMLAMNQHLWKSATSSFTITRVAGAGDWHYEKTVESGNHRFKIYDGTTLVLNYNLGSGLGEYTAGMIRIWDLVAQINSGTGGLFTATQPAKSGKVDGPATTAAFGSLNNISGVIFDAGHGFVATDIVTYIDVGNNRFDQRRILSFTGANQANFFAVVSVLDDLVMGPAGVAAASISPGTLNTNASATQTINFTYWAYVPSVFMPSGVGIGQAEIDQNPWEGYYTTRKASTFVPPSFVNAGNNCHIFTNAKNTASVRNTWQDYPMKFDGQAAYRSGVPPYHANAAFGNALTLLTAVGGGTQTGKYRYSLRYIYTDARGITYTGNPSHFYDELSITLAGENCDILYGHPTVTACPKEDITTAIAAATTVITVPTGHKFKIGDPIAIPTNTPELHIRTVTATANLSVTVSGANLTTAANAFIVKHPVMGFNAMATNATGGTGDSGTPILVPSPQAFHIGDKIYIRDATRNVYTTRTLTGITTTGIYWDTTVEEAITVPAYAASPGGDVNISKNFRVQIFRTKAGGNKYYFIDEVPLPTIRAHFGRDTYRDTHTDASLTIEMDDVPDIGFEHDPPPKGSFGCGHQNLLMIAGDPANPNTIGFSLPDNIEAFPLASNFTDVPSNIQGGITALGSDTESRLSVFKENSYYDCQGDFTTNAFTVRAVNEGDMGVTSHAALRKVNGFLLGPSKIGFVRVYDGVMSRINSNISPAIIQRLTSAQQLNHKAAIGGLDWPNRRYRCYIPASAGFNSGAATTAAVMFVYDYEHQRWFDWSYTSSLEPSGGMTVYNGTHYHLSKSYGGSNASDFPGQVFSDLSLDPTTALIGESYCDNTSGIVRLLKLIVTCDDPSTDKEYLRFKVMSLYGQYEEDQFTANTLTVSTYKNFQDDVVDSTFTMTFNDLLTFEQYQHLPTTVARSLIFSITNSTIKVSPHITGIQVIAGEPFISDKTAG